MGYEIIYEKAMKMDKIQELKKEISTLPTGYISKKTIQGKTRYYRQWKESGKIKSQYIKDSEYEKTAYSIHRRKELESQLKEEISGLSFKTEKPDLELHAIYGSELRDLSSYTRAWEERAGCRDIRAYLFGKVTPRICVVYGLRRTGKTTMLLQVIQKMDRESFSKAVYIKARKGQTMNMLDRDLQKLRDAGYRYVFLDEVTLISDFVDTASFLSDIYAAAGMKIVLSGTDSLGFWFANHEELYDRTYTVHTTWIPYAEHSRLLGTKDVDEYIRYGGTLRVGETDFDDPELKNEEVSFRDDESTRRYIDTAICSNIQHSLKCYENGEHFRHLRELHEHGELTGAINRVIESMNHRFVLRVLTEEFRSNDLSLARKNLLREKNPELRTDLLDRIDLEEVTETLMEILQIRKQNAMETEISEAHLSEIREYLTALELVAFYPTRTIGGPEPIEERAIITQPGMRYCQAQALVFSLMKDSVFASSHPEKKKYVTEKICDEIKGRMLEEIILLETIRRRKGCEVFKFLFDVGEFDMVIYQPEKGCCEIFEIKHSTEFFPEQLKHLCDEEKCRKLSEQFGKIEKKVLIYRGESRLLSNGIHCLNASEYLIALQNSK